MDPSPVLELNAFLPSRNFDLSKQFYLDLGFTLLWSNEEIAQFKIGSFTFLLTPFYAQQHADNFMMALMVEDADAWWKHIEGLGLKDKYNLYMAEPPAMQSWGIRVLYISDPAGVLWHIQDRKKA